MKPTESADAIRAQLATLTAYTHLDGEVPTTPSGPYTVLYAGAGPAVSRRIRGDARQWLHSGRVVCVNNHPHGARWVAEQVVEALDGHRIGDGLVMTSTGPLIADPTQTDGYRWSVTVEYTHRTPRS